MDDSFLRLPNEVLDYILSLSFRKELLEVRFISRQLYAISNVYPFKYQIFNVNAEVKEGFHNILATKNCADSVRSLVVKCPRGPRVRQLGPRAFRLWLDVLKPHSEAAMRATSSSR